MKTPVSKNNRAAVIYFPGRIDRKKLEEQVELNLSSLNWEPTLWLPTSPDQTGGQKALQAIDQNATHLLVAGGDGTVRSVLETLADTTVPGITIGIIPVGTGNVLARNLKIELSDMEVAVKRGLLGNRHDIDLGLAKIIHPDGERTEKYFVVMGGMGLDARIMQNTKLKLKKSLGWFSYVESAVRSKPGLFEYVNVNVDNKEERQLKVISLLIGNAGLLPGNLSLMPDAKLNDGVLHVASVGPRKIWNWIGLWSRVLFANKVIRPTKLGRRFLDATENVKTLENFTCSKIRIRPEKAAHLELDGDVIGLVTEVEFNVVPKAIVVRL